MEPITYLNIRVEGVPFTKITEIEIQQKIGEHGKATVSGEVEEAAAQDIMNRVDEKLLVKITTTAEGQPGTLFCGVVSGAGIQNMNGYAILSLSLQSTSVLLDVEQKNKSYQNTAKTYEEIMTEAVAGKAVIQMNVTDRAIGSMIVQTNETDWAFCKRMASRLGAALVTSVNSEVPVITVGIPVTGNSYDLNSVESRVASNGNSAGNAMVADMLGSSVQTTQYMFLGDSAAYGGSSQSVSSTMASLASGMLVSTVGVSTEQGFAQPEIVNTQIAGKMYTGKVQAVQKDQVQVHLVDIDREYDAGGSVWLPYSTAYSSSDGSGFYCMPSVGDTVRVFFPGTSEGEAFAASSVSVNAAPNVTDKLWRGANGKQILLTEEGIYITTNASDSKIFINLTDEEGITITSDKNITICAKKNLTMMSNDTISITAENDILISSAESYIDIKPDSIELGAENVVIK